MQLPAMSNMLKVITSELFLFSRFMSSPFRNCELSGKDIRSIGQFELDYALGMDFSITELEGF